MTKSRLLILCILLLSLIGCNKSDEGKCEIMLEESTFSMDKNGGTLSIPFTLSPSSVSGHVEVSSDASWLMAGVVSSELRLVCAVNNTGYDRQALITLSWKGVQKAYCHIVQSADSEVFGIFPESKLVYVEPGECDVTLNFDLHADFLGQVLPKAVVGVGSDWLHVNGTTMSSVKLHVDANMYDERDAEITISYPTVDDVKVVLVQNAFIARSTIKVPSSVVTADCSAQSLEATYSVSGASAGQCVEASLTEQAPWIRITGVSSSKISFELDENSSEANRSAQVKLSLPDARPVVLTLIQKADSPFDIDVRNVTSASATVSFKPKSETMTYAYSVEPKSLFESLGSEAYIEAYLESMLEMAEEYGVSLGDMLASGPKTISIDKLKDNTDYYALAFDLDADGKSSGKVTLLEFRTPKAVPSENKFSFQVSDAGVVSVRTTNDDPYIFDVWDISSWNEFETPLALAERFVEYMKGFDGALQTYTHRGDYSEDYKQYLTPGKNVAFAFGYKDGITTDVYYYVFDW